MKKITLLMMTMLAAVMVSATVVTMDFTSSDELLAMGIDSIPAVSKDWKMGSKSLSKGGVTLTGSQGTATTDNRIFNSNGNLTLRSYKNGSITFAVTGEDVIKGLIITGSPVAFTGVTDGVIATNSNTVTLPCTANSTIKTVKVYVNENLPSMTVDTISVSEARARIDNSDFQACVIKGVVCSAPFKEGSYYAIWLTDIDNPGDSIEGFKMRPNSASTSAYTSLDEMAAQYGLLDTVMIKAEGLTLYTNATKTIYETTSGYYLSTIGKSSAINGNSVFKYGFGAKQCGMAYDGERYKYEVILSKVSEDDTDHALHMTINSKSEKGIAGEYTIRCYNNDTSYVDGEGPVAGTLKLTFEEETGNYIKYNVVADFTVGGQLYRIDSIYELPGWVNDLSDSFKFTDDIPFIPDEGDTITCAQALSYAKILGSSTSTLTVYIHGFATGFQSIQGRAKQSVYMADSATAPEGIAMGYLCYTQNLDSIVQGDEILVKGKIMYYSAKSVAQIKDGKIYRIGGSNTQRPRTINCVEAPDAAISVDSAMAIGNALVGTAGQSVSTTEEYTVVGFITNVDVQTYNGKATWYMHDVMGEFGDFEAYSCQIPTIICKNDKVYAKGKISKYTSADGQKVTIEISQGTADFVCTPTDLEPVAAAVVEKTGAKKVIMNGQMFILKDGVLYNALGVAVQ